MWGIGSVVSNAAGAARVRDTGTTGSIKNAFGNLFLNLTAAAGSIGIAGLAKRVGGPELVRQFGTAAGQRNVAEELIAPSGRDAPAQRKRIDQSRYLPALIVAGLGVVALAGVLAFRAFRKR